MHFLGNNYEFAPSESISNDDFCYATKARYKFGRLEVFTHLLEINDRNGAWQIIPEKWVNGTLHVLTTLRIKVQGSKAKYIDEMLKLL